MTSTRRDKGSGSIYQRASDGLWVGYLTLPDGPGGKRRRKVLTARTKPAVTARLRTLRRDLDAAGDLTLGSPRLDAWLARWLDDTAAGRLKPRTLDSYRGVLVRYVYPTIGRTRMDKLTPTHITRLHTAMRDAGQSSTTALQTHRVLSVALRDAMRAGVITRNPCALVDAPRREVSTRGALTAQDAGTLLRSVAAAPDIAVRCSLALLAGLRQGEALGLTRDAIDLEAGTLTVMWQVQRITWQHGCGPVRSDGSRHCGLVRAGSCPQRTRTLPPGQEGERLTGGLWLTRPKSRAGWREVPIVGLLAEVLGRYMTTTEPGARGLLLHRDDGAPIDPAQDSRAWHAALVEAGLPPVPLHSARHTTATLLYQLGVPEQTRVAIMGHSSATTTAGYTHVTDTLARDAMARLDNLVRGAIGGTAPIG